MRMNCTLSPCISFFIHKTLVIGSLPKRATLRIKACKVQNNTWHIVSTQQLLPILFLFSLAQVLFVQFLSIWHKKPHVKKKINRFEQNSKPRVEHILARRLLQLNSSHTHEARPDPSFFHYHDTPALIPSLVSFIPFTSLHHSISSTPSLPLQIPSSCGQQLSLLIQSLFMLHLLPSLVSITLIHPAKCLSF